MKILPRNRPYRLLTGPPIDAIPSIGVRLPRRAFRSVHHMASNLSFSAGVSVALSSLAHLPTSAPFRVRAPGPVSGQLYRDHRRRSRSRCPLLSCRLSATGIRVLGIRSRQGIGPSLRSAYRVRRTSSRDTARTLTGFPCSARGRPGWVWVSSGPRGRRCSHDRSVVLGRRLPPLNGVVPATLVFLPAPRFENDEASSRIHGRSPVQPSPRL